MAIGFGWEATTYPKDGFTSITFPLTVEEQDPCERGWYFAYQFHFITDAGDMYDGNRGYTGVQPRPNSSGPGFHAYCPFSRWGTQEPGDIVDPDRCAAGADGASGISCNELVAIDDFRHGREYLFTVETDAVRGGEMGLWRGFVTDAVTLDERQLGAWWAPSGQRTKGLRPWESAFTEMYLDPECGEIPYARIRYGVPYSTTAPDARFQLGSAREGEWCRGKQNFSSYLDADGARVVEIGWRRKRGRSRLRRCAPTVNVEVNVNTGCGGRCGPGGPGDAESDEEVDDPVGPGMTGASGTDSVGKGLVWSAVDGDPLSIQARWVDAPGPYTLYWDDWDFVAMQPGQQSVKHTYAKAGTYTAACDLKGGDGRVVASVVIRPRLSPTATLADLGGGRVRLTLGEWPHDRDTEVAHRVDWGDATPAELFTWRQLAPGHNYRQLRYRPTITITDVPARRDITLLGPAPAPALSASFDRRSSWHGGYSGDIRVRNDSPHRVDGWRVEFTLAEPASVEDVWPSAVGKTKLGPGRWVLHSPTRVDPGKTIASGLRVEHAGDPPALPANLHARSSNDLAPADWSTAGTAI